MLKQPVLHSPALVTIESPLTLDQCLAKSFKTQDSTLPGRNVLSHCQIVGLVAREMMRRMPEFMREEFFPDGAELIAAAHDIGKVSPTFQKKIYSALSQPDQSVSELLKSFDVTLEKQWGGHGGVSQATADGLKVGQYIPQILGQHHGYAPNLTMFQANSEVFGGAPWYSQRAELLSQLKSVLGCNFPEVTDQLQARVLAGFTTVSDWIGSGKLFDRSDDDSSKKVEQALDEAGYVEPKVISGLSFFDVFGFAPKDAQLKLIEAVDAPGVYVLEAPMGLGKTEAALYASYVPVKLS